MNKLWEAIDVINERGWARRTMRSPDGRVCLIGALRTAHGYNPSDCALRNEGAYGADRDIVVGIISSEYGTKEPTDFNDDIAKSKEDVIRVLEKAAIKKDELV